MSQENVEIVRRAYEQLAEQDALGDWSWFFEEFAHSELELHPQGTYLDAEGSYRGARAGQGSGANSPRSGSGGASTPTSSNSSMLVSGS